MQIPTQRKPKALTLTADSKLPYPTLSTAEDRFEDKIKFWLAHWFREQRQYGIVHKALLKRATNYRLPEQEQDAFWQAIHQSRRAANETLNNLKISGGLLFAWAGSSVLAQGGAA